MKPEEIENQKQKIKKAIEIKKSLDEINCTLKKAQETNSDYGLAYIEIGEVDWARAIITKAVVLKLLTGEKARLEKELEEI